MLTDEQQRIRDLVIAKQCERHTKEAIAAGAEPDIAIYLIRKRAEELGADFDVAHEEVNDEAN